MALAMRKGWAVLGSWCPGCIVRGVWYLVGTVCASHSCSYTTPKISSGHWGLYENADADTVSTSPKLHDSSFVAVA
jgi:hypothetical protein